MDIIIKKLDADSMNFAKQLFEFFQIDDGVENPTEASDEYLQDLLSRDDFHVITAIVNEKVIGGLTAYELKKYKRETTEIYLYEIGVETDHRKRGVATALIEYLKKICAKKRISAIFVGAVADNLPAIKLYEKTGGKGTEVIEFEYELALEPDMIYVNQE